jgi:hypothetical protein
MSSVPGPSNSSQSDRRWSVMRIVILLTLCLVIVNLVTCKGRGTSGGADRWDWIIQGLNNERYFVDRNSIAHMSNDIIRVSFKYSPSKSEFFSNIQELSREFGKEPESAHEYTISTWEFNCSKPEARCLSLTHYKKDSKFASYEYPQQSWSALSKAAGTKMLRDIICAETSGSKK